jgi:hypothetical protein
MLAVALVSLSSLLLELALTRLFSVVLFYHFAFFAISVALLGLGSGGVFAHVRQEWLERFDMRTLGTRLCLLNSIFILAAVEVVLHTPVSLEVTGRNFGGPLFFYRTAFLCALCPVFRPNPTTLRRRPCRRRYSLPGGCAAAELHWRAQRATSGVSLHGCCGGLMGGSNQDAPCRLRFGRGIHPADRR